MPSGMLQPHPIDQLHNIVRPHWHNALWFLATGLIFGIGWAVGSHVGAYLTHWLK